MIPNSFTYHRPGSVDDAISMLSQNGDDAKILAGGHSLIPAMKLRLNQPENLIDIRKVPELQGISKDGETLVIGAAATHHEINASALVRGHLSMLAEGAGHIGDPAVRNVGTIGGSIAHADPAADWPAMLMAADATIVVKGSGGERRIRAHEFFTGFYETALAEGEIITSIRIPNFGPNASSHYAKFVQPASRFAIVGCGVVCTWDNGRIYRAKVAFTGVSEGPFRDEAVESELNGKTPSAEVFEAAAAKAAEGVSIMSDHYASEKYRKHLAKVYCRRALSALAVR